VITFFISRILSIALFLVPYTATVLYEFGEYGRYLGIGLDTFMVLFLPFKASSSGACGCGCGCPHQPPPTVGDLTIFDVYM
jgi:hypothetical protein